MYHSAAIEHNENKHLGVVVKIIIRLIKTKLRLEIFE